MILGLADAVLRGLRMNLHDTYSFIVLQIEYTCGKEFSLGTFMNSRHELNVVGLNMYKEFEKNGKSPAFLHDRK